jgi:hypothetical protein
MFIVVLKEERRKRWKVESEISEWSYPASVETCGLSV